MSDFSHIPDGYHSVTPSTTYRSTEAALRFYTAAFGATESFRMPGPDGRIMHAEMKIGNSAIMMSDEYPEEGAVAPEEGKGALYMIYVEDVDAMFAQAIAAGAEELQPLQDMFWGDRTARVADPFGYRWTLAQKTREVSPEEIETGAKQWGEENS